MNIQTYQDYFNSFKNLYLDKRVQGQFVNQVNLLDVPCPDSKIAIQLILDNGTINFFGNSINDTGTIPLKEKFLNQKIIYCFTEHKRKFNWRQPFTCEWVYAVTWIFTNGCWISYDNPINIKNDSCEALFVESL